MAARPAGAALQIEIDHAARASGLEELREHGHHAQAGEPGQQEARGERPGSGPELAGRREERRDHARDEGEGEQVERVPGVVPAAGEAADAGAHAEAQGVDDVRMPVDATCASHRLAQQTSGSAKIVVQALSIVAVRCASGGLMAG